MIYDRLADTQQSDGEYYGRYTARKLTRSLAQRSAASLYDVFGQFILEQLLDAYKRDVACMSPGKQDAQSLKREACVLLQHLVDSYPEDFLSPV